jgi:AraC-like DNA-binding protein
MSRTIIREITPLSASDCFTLQSHEKKTLDIPLHYHEEYELTLILNGRGAKRVVGDSIEIIGDLELVLFGPNLYHGWFNQHCTSDAILEVTIQFHKNLLDEMLLKRNQFFFIKSMFENAQRGIHFSNETVKSIAGRILNLKQKNRFESVLELLSILHSLSISDNMKVLSHPGFSDEKFDSKSRRIGKIFEHLHNNYNKQITVSEIAKIVNMPDASLCRFIKRRTGKTLIDSLNEIRLGHASRMLIASNDTISEVAYKAGFNNISNFNRIFKRKKLCVPKEFRETYTLANGV